MKHLPPKLLFVALLISGAGRAADEALAPADSPLLQTAPPPRSAVASPADPPRLVSTDVASKLAASRPKFVPKPEPKEPADLPDLRDTDKPRNGIIRLPAYVVRDQKFPVFKERDLLTPAGRLREAYRRQPGLRFGSLPFLSNNDIALSMLEEELRLERLGEFYGLIGVMSLGDRAGANSVLKSSMQTFRHSNEWVSGPGGWSGGWAERKLR